MKRQRIDIPTGNAQASKDGVAKQRQDLYRMIIDGAKKDRRTETKETPTLVAWLKLLRVPNLLTVPGDPVVGFFSWSSIRYFSSVEKSYLDIGNVMMLIPCMISVLLLYCAGLIVNDLMDMHEDSLERRGRPLPSGAVSASSAAAAATMFFIGGLAAAWFNGAFCAGIAGVLSLTIITYNAWAKRVKVIGPLTMGLCRGLSIFMGLAVSSSLGLGMDSRADLLNWEKLSMLLSWPFFSITPMILYIAAVTLVASKETDETPMRFRQWLPMLVVAAWMPFLAQPHPPWNTLPQAAEVVVIAGLPVLIALACACRLRDNPSPRTVQRTVGDLVGNLLLIQGAAVYFNSASTNARAEALPFAIALGAAYPVFILLSRRFHAS